MPSTLHGNKVTTPSPAEAAVAKESSRTLAPHVGTKPLRLRLGDGKGEELILPSGVAKLLLDVLTEMSHGNAVTVAPVQAELTTNQAAELLNVSRPYLTKLLEDGVISFRKVGTHHRVRLEDVLAYKQSEDARRLRALEELAAQAQELKMGY